MRSGQDNHGGGERGKVSLPQEADGAGNRRPKPESLLFVMGENRIQVYAECRICGGDSISLIAPKTGRQPQPFFALVTKGNEFWIVLDKAESDKHRAAGMPGRHTPLASTDLEYMKERAVESYHSGEREIEP